MSTGPADPQQRARWYAARRQVARQHHPDRGGDVDTYLAALAAVDQQFAVTGARVEVRTDVWARLRRDLVRRRRGTRARVRALRQRMPRGLPGSRRYFEL